MKCLQNYYKEIMQNESDSKDVEIVYNVRQKKEIDQRKTKDEVGDQKKTDESRDQKKKNEAGDQKKKPLNV